MCFLASWKHPEVTNHRKGGILFLLINYPWTKQGCSTCLPTTFYSATIWAVCVTTFENLCNVMPGLMDCSFKLLAVNSTQQFWSKTCLWSSLSNDKAISYKYSIYRVILILLCRLLFHSL
uniref:Uncharacterized protein n=1 Tax=Cacopsylla melanoneura TaxID=428564 RepID=A0A8D8V243_9HEMI